MKTKRKKKFELAEHYAHRGFHDKPEIPENSMAAFRRAIANRLPTELDVHLLADGKLVVFHDDDLERETGVKGSIEAYDLSNLRKLRLEGTDEVIPTFDEVLQLYEGSGLPLLIELKVVRGNHKALASAVAKRLKDYKGEYVIQSFYPRVLMEIRKLMPDVAIGQLSKNYFNYNDGAIMVHAAMTGNILFNRLVRPDFISYKFRDKHSNLLMRSVEKRGMSKLAWTIRTPDAYRRAVEAGCTPIFENFNPNENKGDLR